MSTIGWIAIAGAVLFAVAMLRALVAVGSRFPLDPEIHAAPPRVEDPTEPQWPGQAQLEARVGLARRSRREWKRGAPFLLRPLLAPTSASSHAVTTQELNAPGRFDHTWIDETLDSLETDLGLAK